MYELASGRFGPRFRGMSEQLAAVAALGYVVGNPGQDDTRETGHSKPPPSEPR